MEHVEAVAASIYLKIIKTYTLVVPKHHINMWIRNSTLLNLFGEFLKAWFWKKIFQGGKRPLTPRMSVFYTLILLNMNKLANI